MTPLYNGIYKCVIFYSRHVSTNYLSLSNLKVNIHFLLKVLLLILFRIFKIYHLFIFYMYGCFNCLYVCAPHECLVSIESEECVRSPFTGVTDGCQ